MKPSRSARVITIALLTGICGALALRERAVTASNAEQITWGASSPAWSPDGSRLAFSLFGSIWKVSSGGGEAKQLTESPGYHAHPSWSPEGDRIAFVRGSRPPRHRTLNVPGKLVILDLKIGREKEIATPFPTRGTLAWSPDGNSIVCGLGTDEGAYLYRINLSEAKVRQIQFPLSENMRHTPTPPEWVDVTWNWQRNELFFAGFRTGNPQIWSMPGDTPPILVQMPLTAYRSPHEAELRALSTTPDGSSVIYSAALPNGTGNFELYHLPRTGGEPVAITHTPRDEFTPAVSPDGLQIAHVSNYLGNIDIFVTPREEGEPKHVPIEDLNFLGASGQVRVRVLDEFGEPTRARLYVRASDGKAYCPAGSPIHYYSLEPGGPLEGFFLSEGDDSFPAPAGPLRIVARKGFEYRVTEKHVEVRPNQTAQITIQLERWTNWNQRGWYSGENHVHGNYGGSYYARPKQALNWMMAEDYNAVNMAVANSYGAFLHDSEFFRGQVDPVSTGNYVLSYGQEYRNQYPYGHMMFLNLKRLILPGYSSFPGSDRPYDYPMNTTAALKAQGQGGFVSYAHPIGRHNDPFDRMNGARELPIALAEGAVDSIDVLPYGESAYQVWYRFLNSGFRIPPGAGTDAFLNYRGMNELPGEARQYVEVGPAMNWERWLERYRQGRVFVTMGPLLTFTVNGQALGTVIPVAEGQPYSAKLVTEVMADSPIRQVEFIQNGRVIESRKLPGSARRFRMEKNVTLTESCWFAARAMAEPTRGGPALSMAHTGAIYVDVGGRPTRQRRDIELMIRWIDRLWAYLIERDNFGSVENRQDVEQTVDKAREYYRSLLAKLD